MAHAHGAPAGLLDDDLSLAKQHTRRSDAAVLKARFFLQELAIDPLHHNFLMIKTRSAAMLVNSWRSTKTESKWRKHELLALDFDFEKTGA